MLLPICIHIPTLYAYGFLVFARSLCLAVTFPVVARLGWMRLPDRSFYHKLQCRIILEAHAAHSCITFETIVHLYTVLVCISFSTFTSPNKFSPCNVCCFVQEAFLILDAAFLLRSFARHSYFTQARNFPASDNTNYYYCQTYSVIFCLVYSARSYRLITVFLAHQHSES